MKPIIKKYIGSAVRHGLTLAAGFLASKGITDVSPDSVTGLESPITEIATALVMFGVATVWSLIEKKSKA